MNDRIDRLLEDQVRNGSHPQRVAERAAEIEQRLEAERRRQERRQARTDGVDQANDPAR